MTTTYKFGIECFNLSYIPFHNDPNPIRIVYGGRDSAKSHEVGLEFLMDLMSLDYCKIVLVRKVYRDIKGSQFEQIVSLIQEFKIEHLFEIKVSPLEIIYKPNPNNRIIAKGLDKAEKAKSMKDPTHAWYEEADQITYDDYITFSLGLRSSKTDVIKEILTFNPGIKTCWINDAFFPAKETYERPDGKFMEIKSTQEGVSIYHMTYMDNEFISKQRVQKLLRLKHISKEKYKVNVLGLWGSGLEGLVFDSYDLIESIPSQADTYFGIDYGFSNPSAVVEIGHSEGSIYWDELVYQRKLTASDLVEKVIEFRSRIGNKPVVVDSANAALIEELRRAGFNVFEAVKGPNSVVDGVNWLKGYRHVITKRSVNIIQNFDNYVYGQDKYGNNTDTPVKADDHAIDGGRYAAWKFGFIEGRWLSGGNQVIALSPTNRTRPTVRGGLRKSKINR